MAMNRWTALVLILALGAPLVHTQYRVGLYHVVPGRVDSDGFPMTAARICLDDAGTDRCYTPPDFQKGSSFGLNPKATALGQLNGQDLTLFTATFSAGGSGELTNYALLTVRDGGFVNLLPKMQLTNQSEFAVWNLPEFSGSPILVTADFVWNPYGMQGSANEQETHFGHHRYTVQVFMYDSAAGRYAERVKYVTERSYPGLNALDAIKVIDPERRKILAQLRKGAPR
jgi:hypothetical protein